MLTTEQNAENLRHALKMADIIGPYVLVGHSIGGVYARTFARRYPQDVAGLVLVDSAHENQHYRLPPEAMKQTTMIKWLASFLRLLSPVGIPRALKLADRMQGENFPEAIRHAAMARMYQTHFFKALLQEVNAVEVNTSQLQPPTDLGDTPVFVLSRGGNNPGLPEEQFKELKICWEELQKELTVLSTKSRHIIAEKSGHYIHHDQPELVIESIREIVEMVTD